MIYLRPFIGVQGSGKDFNCQKLVKEEGYFHLNFADEVREITWMILDWRPETHEEYEKFKVTEITFLGKKCLGRVILRRIGNGLREKLGEDLWIQQWKIHFWNHVDNGITKFCVSDLRYPNEFEFFKSLGRILEEPINLKIAFCNYKSERYAPGLEHESEKMANEFLQKGFVDGQLIYSDT
jgi:hypothetical protein